jgi:hypothetical protein
MVTTYTYKTRAVSQTGSSNLPAFTLYDLQQGRIRLVVPSPKPTYHDVHDGSERDFLAVVESIIKVTVDAGHQRRVLSYVLDGLRSHDMDNEGKFFVIDNLWHISKVKKMGLIQLRDEVATKTSDIQASVNARGYER